MNQTLSVQVYGEYIKSIPACDEYLTLNFSPTSAPRKRRWSNYGLSADFLGDYFAAFFPGDAIPDSKINQRDTVKAAVSYIANELLENAVKYNDDSSNIPISISLYLYEEKIIFLVRNCTNQMLANRYQQFVQKLLEVDLDSYYMQQLEKAAKDGRESSMGILTIMNDYGARFGWEFKPVVSSFDFTQVNVMVHLDV